jgi:hypothetical protein
MKQPALLCLILIPVFALISCSMATVENPYQNLEPGAFWAQILAAGNSYGNYYEVDAVLLAKGEKCVVWAERSAGVSVATGEAIAREYDRNIYSKIVNVFGSPELMAEYDVDEDDRLTLLLLDIKDGFNGSGAYTAGYFYSNDLFKPNSNNHSNGRDMIYVDTNPSRLRSQESYATIAHELQHFLNYVSRSAAGRQAMDTWIDEGLSAAAEYIYLGRHNQERVAQFAFSETVRQGNNFFVWKDRPNNLLDDYSTVYLFFQWLRIQSREDESGGTAIYRRIIDSEYYDYRAVTGAISGAFAERLGSTSWETTLRSWLAANYINSPDGLYGYHGELPDLHVWALGGLTQSLLPGEGVYSAVGDTPGAFPNSGGPNIKYAGLRKTTESPQDSPLSLDTLYPKGKLLTFNSNADNSKKRSETGRLTNGEAEPIPEFRSGRSVGQPGTSWAIDARDIMGRPDDADD